MTEKLGRPCLPAASRHEVRKSIYLTDSEESEYLSLYRSSPHRSQSAFLAELLRRGAAAYRRQIQAESLDPAA